jgi:recombination protein RecT
LTPAEQQQQAMETIKKWIGQKSSLFETLLGGPNAARRFAQVLILACFRNPALLTCDLKSLFNAATFCAQRGLEPGVPDGVALVPFKGKVTPIIQYRALVKQGKETDSIKAAKAIIIYKEDAYEWEEGETPKFSHKPAPLGEARGIPIGAYSRITLPDGQVEINLMPIADIYKRRNASAAWKGDKREETPWFLWEDEMIKKTVLKDGFRTIPVAPQFMKLLDADGGLESGKDVTEFLDVQISDVFEPTPTGEPEFLPPPTTKSDALADKLAGATNVTPPAGAEEKKGEPEKVVEPEKKAPPLPSEPALLANLEERAKALGVEADLFKTFNIAAWANLTDPQIIHTVDLFIKAYEDKAAAAQAKEAATA